jgi:hypothetical protein
MKTFEPSPDSPTPWTPPATGLQVRVDLPYGHWPRAFVELVAEWVCCRERIDWPYVVTVTRPSKNTTYRGHGRKAEQRCFVPRRYERPGYVRDLRRAYEGLAITLQYNPDARVTKREALDWAHGRVKRWPVVSGDQRFPDIRHGVEFRSTLDILIFVMAHEAHHATGGHPSNFKSDLPRLPTDPALRRRVERERQRDSLLRMETACNAAGLRALLDFRAEWPGIRSALRQRLARTRLETTRRAAVRAGTGRLAGRTGGLRRSLKDLLGDRNRTNT